MNSYNNKSNIEAKIAARYNDNLAVAKRKNITFNVDEELLERLDSVVNVFNEKDGTTTRNAIIEEAILEYVETAEDYFEKQNVNQDKDPESSVEYDTAVFPATNLNFVRVFLGQHQWYYVRMAEHRISNTKYIALYRGAPKSAITHYAEVIDISDPDPCNDNKRLIRVKEPIELPQPVELGNIHVNNVRKLFYTVLDKLKSVNTVEELLK